VAETSKKWNGGRVPANGSRAVNTYMLGTSRLLSANAQNKWAKQPVWAASFYNFQTNKWEPEAEHRTYRQAYSRATYLSRQNPYHKVAVVLVPGATRSLKSRDLAPAAETVE